MVNRGNVAVISAVIAPFQAHVLSDRSRIKQASTTPLRPTESTERTIRCIPELTNPYDRLAGSGSLGYRSPGYKRRSIQTSILRYELPLAVPVFSPR